MREPWERPRLTLHRAADISAAGAGLVFFAPTLLVIAVLLRLSDGGPVLAKRTQVSRNGRTYQSLRFRTEANQAELEADPRNSVGQFLKRSGFDTLPRLYNVLRGDITLTEHSKR